ncbi:MAG: 30S ribosomal protein S3 [Ignavibacteria bacterium]|nr:30S ribosomal protein S3 [Bacteroidota bacterium]MSQ46148.1 30S ribosomal protein S3 [Ignavibacteria bacterium]
MGQKTHPIGFRLGIIKGWDSNWFEQKNYASKLKEDEVIRNFVHTKLKAASISKVIIDRTPKYVCINIHTARPGVVIGKSGKDIAILEEELRKLTNKDIKILISEIKRPELDATLVADTIARQLEARVAFRRAMKQALTSARRMGAEGIRIKCGGRLGGADIARTEQYKEGRIPLHTLRADIDYASTAALTIYGLIGVKVWICKGEILEKNNK